MARRSHALFNTPTIKIPDTVNRDGYAAYTRPIEEQYAQTLLTNTFGNTYYATERDLVQESTLVNDAMLAKDPDFASKAIVYARTKGFMRTQPIFALAKLAAIPGPYFELIFNKVIRTPNDLSDFFTIMRSLRKGEGGRRIKRVAGKWLTQRLSEYWAVKYGADKSDGYSLADMIKVTHAKGPANPLFDYLLSRKGYVFEPGKLPQVAAFERLKKATTIDEKLEAITAGKLPHEVASTFVGKDAKGWEAIVFQMPIFAMLRNLATMERLGIMKGEVRDHVIKTFTDQATITKSMILPFRFVEAMNHVTDDKVKDALRDALELSFTNVPAIPGRTAFFLDVSGSMHGFLPQASVFACSGMKKAQDGRIILFDTRAHVFGFSMRDSVLTQAQKIRCGGGTDVGAPMRQLLVEKDKVDNIVCITDEQQNTGSAFFKALETYRMKVNGAAKCFVLNVAPYVNTSLIPVDDGKSYMVYGWSDAALRYVGMASQGWGSFVEAIKSGVWDDVQTPQAE